MSRKKNEFAEMIATLGRSSPCNTAKMLAALEMNTNRRAPRRAL